MNYWIIRLSIIIVFLVLISSIHIIPYSNSFSSSMVICYRIVFPNDEVIRKCINCTNDKILVFNNIHVSIIYEENIVNEYNASIYRTKIEIDTGEELLIYNTMHILFTNSTLIYELYYDDKTKLLVYGLITDQATLNEYEIVLTSRPSYQCMISHNTTSIQSITTTDLTNTITNSTGTSETTKTSITDETEVADSYNSEADIFLMIVITILCSFATIFFLIHKRRTT